MNKRALETIRLLYNHTNCYVSGAFIAKSLSVSPRTIRNDIKMINGIAATHGFYIESKKSAGYKIDIKDKSKFNLFINNQYLKDELLNFNNQESRVHFILSKLLILDNYVKIERLSERMYVSDTTVKKDLKVIRNELDKYELQLISSPYYGLKIEGSEFQKRYAIANMLLDKPYHNHTFDTDKINDLKEQLIKLINQFQITIPDVKLENLVIHIYIAMFRVENKFMIADKDNIFQNFEYYDAELKHFFQAIVGLLEQRYDVILPIEEKQYIKAHIAASGIVSKKYELIDRKEINDLIHQMFNKIQDVFQINLDNELELKKNLTLHLSTSINRYKYKMNIRNPILTEIKKNYPYAFDIALVGGKVIEEAFKIKISESEIGFLALHFQLVLQKAQSVTEKIRATIVCASGMASSELIKYKLLENFGNALTMTDSQQMYELSKETLKNTDLIIATVPLSREYDVPVITVNTILTQEDILQLNHFINNYDKNENEQLIEIFDLKSGINSKETLLTAIESDLKQLDYIEPNFLKQVYEREAVATTAYGNLIAVPHPVTPQAKQSFIYVIKLDKPIKWETKEVQLIFCLGLKQHTTVDMKPIFKKLSYIINDFNVVLNLISQQNNADLRLAYKTISNETKLN
ncbi:BglG family transcription antiterminator [Staphylococcus gallinarum]|uniref:BglG family transcription antiterminator n=1 Tax=Staphylococcus gallinarum TaxID=1293 RepID=UPI001E5C8807|nr:BglG family transcription antiterminator [Staphylococcus gallinarum]MCD8860031.1 BglG family transcription antiterminator [Staphylococcus gallinarum]